MIQFIISLINITVLFNGIAVITKHLLPTISKSLQVFLSVIISFASLSFIYFTGLALKQEFTTLLIIFTCINLSHLYWTYPKLLKQFNFKRFSINHHYDIVPLAAILMMSVFFVFHGSKYGDFDSWTLWNTHAKFLYYPKLWTRMRADHTYMAQSDYPLMLPSLIAFFWKIINSTSYLVPVLLSFSFTISISLLLYYALRDEFKNRAYAYFALFLLVTDYHFQLLNTAQCADMLLSLFILSTFVIHNYLKRSNLTTPAYVLGFICASCTWIKNEGDLFYVVFTIVFFISNYKNVAYIKKYVTGSIIPIIVVISFKAFFAPVNDLIAANNNGTKLIHNIEDLSRYVTIVEMYSKTFVEFFWAGVVMFFALLLVNRTFFRSFAFAIFFLMFLGFTFVYLTTPHDLTWHIYTSFYRLIYQVYPSLIYTALISCGYKFSKSGAGSVVYD